MLSFCVCDGRRYARQGSDLTQYSCYQSCNVRKLDDNAGKVDARSVES
jgi:hypothetical protein